MVVWAFVVVGMAILSYLADVDVLPIFRKPIPVLQGSLMSVLLILYGLAMMCRVGYVVRKGEKEDLKKRVQELEKKLKEKGMSEG